MNLKNKRDIHNGISYIIPTFNCENTIEESVFSILKGNYYAGDEIIIVDDCSIDSTLLILIKLQRTYPQIHIYQNKWNKGSAESRNIAIEKAKNNYIFCLDSDNILVKHSVRKLFKYMCNMQADSAAFQYIYFFKNSLDDITHKWKFKNGTITLADTLASYIVPGSSGNYLFTKKSWIKAGGYPQCRTLDTWGFGFRQLASNSKMVILPNTYYYHRYGHDSNWIRENRKGKNSLIALGIILPFIDLIDKNDINHILSVKYRHDWFDKLQSRPLKLVNRTVGEGGEIVRSKLSHLNKLLDKSNEYKKYKVNKRYINLINGSTISHEGMQLLTLIVKKISPMVVLEFGSGLSTLFLSNVISKKSLLISVEDNIEYLNKTMKILDKFRKNTIVQCAPITRLTFKLKSFLSYELTYLKYLTNKKLDLVFIDGPLGYKYGREYSIYALIPYITNKTIFVLDDSNRFGEQEALTNWKRVFVDGLEIIHLKQIKCGMTVFRIINPKNISRFPFATLDIINSIIHANLNKSLY